MMKNCDGGKARTPLDPMKSRADPTPHNRESGGLTDGAGNIK